MSRWGGRRVAKLRALVLEVYGPVCWLCHTEISLTAVYPDAGYLTVDHVVPQVRGGGDEIRNLRPAHLGCNSARQDREPAALAARRPHRLGRFSPGQPAGEAPPLPLSPRNSRKTP